MRNKLIFCCMSLCVAALSSCGGGDSKNSTPTRSSAVAVVTSSLSSPSSISSSSQLSSSVSSSSVAPVREKASATISGVVYAKDVAGVESVIDDPESVTVTLSLIGKDGNVVGLESPELIDSLANKGIPFSSEVSGSDAQYIVVNISRPGYTDYARRFEFTKELNLTATLNELPQETIAVTNSTSISGKAVAGFNVSIVTSDSGSEISEGASALADLSVSIPQSALPVGTTSIDVKMQAYDPNDAEDAENFPGAYADSDGNKLLSVAFNYTDIKTNTGVSLQKIAQKTRKDRLAAQKKSGKIISPTQFAKQVAEKTEVAAEPVIINRKIPVESCLALAQLGDSSSTLDGFQVPVYTYNPVNGLWDLLGQGTLFTEGGALVSANQTVFDCQAQSYVLEIEATNEIFLSNWWNLDYPLVFEQPVKLCANVQFKDEGGNPIIGSTLFVSDDDDLRSFSSEMFVTDDNGIVHIELMSLDKGADLTATAQFFNSSLVGNFASKEIQLSTSCDVTTPPVVVPVEVPALCKVSGKVTDAYGVALASRLVIAGNFTAVNNDQWLIPAFANTDANGNYTLTVECDKKYQITEWFSWIFTDTAVPVAFNVNVNGTVDEQEITDNSSVATMNNLVTPQTKPLAFLTTTENSLTQMTFTVMYAGNDFPLTYSFNLVNEQEVVVGQFSGSFSKDDLKIVTEGEWASFPIADKQIEHKLTATPDFTYYKVDGTITDSKGNKAPIVGAIYFGTPQ